MPSYDNPVPALLLRLDANPFHHGTLAAVRSLGRAGVQTHVLLDGPVGPLGRSRHLTRVHRPGPEGTTGTVQLLRRLREIAAEIGRPAVLLPLDDRGALAVARLSEHLAGHYLLPRPDPGLLERVADKGELATLCAEHGIAHPETRSPRSAPEAARAARELGLPVVAKWSRPWLLPPGSGLRSTTVLHEPRQAYALHEAGAARTPYGPGEAAARNSGARGAAGGGRLLLQRRLPAGPGCDWFFHGYIDATGRLLAGGTGRKERCWPLSAGLTATGRWVPNPRLERIATGFAAAIGYRGILDLDFRHEAAGDTYHLLDFNPRPGAQFRLFTDVNGLDVVRAAHLDLSGHPVPVHIPVPGRRLVVEQYALAATLLAPVRRSGPAGRLPRAAGRETAWYARDDPLPFLALLAALQRRLAARLLGRLRRALRRSRPDGPPSRTRSAGRGPGRRAPATARRAPADPALRAPRPRLPGASGASGASGETGAPAADSRRAPSRSVRPGTHTGRHHLQEENTDA
ncbi:ATP-grasp domain-containing protein [Streptomyces sp. XM4193]|uniref:carboxylate--amine ligase n=1 Tax=Streptomyces sp. XM4193 TaxID=2929782 RepID=UPI001FF8A10C|nr:ATP-grasp domain-containing protein [Streptomyces sp. XM4193]MCK1797968.1 ATP-grasp domain-containing protein [Streptomyces sp. XM4193]